MSTKKAKAAPIRSVIKDSYIQVIVNKKPFSMDSTNPLFKRMKTALKKKNWNAVPKLINLSENLLNQTKGDVSIEKGVIYYKSKPTHSSLSKRIMEMLTSGKNVNHMLSFMDNLYQNPSSKAIQHFYDWLQTNELPITKDGHFLCYKSVDHNRKDEHTHTIDNSPGQTIFCDRKLADDNWEQQCSSGFHVCSKQYGLYGRLVMAVKVNPRDVLSAQGGKMRIVKYEVLRELGTKASDLFEVEGFSDLENKLVVDMKSERQEMIKKLLTLADIKRKIRTKKINKASFAKQSFARLKTLFQKYGLAPAAVGPEDKLYLSAARKAAGLTIGQIAKQMHVSYKVAATMEKNEKLKQDTRDKFAGAIAKLTGSRMAVSYPKPVAQ